jgi:hypothetical protein
MNTGGGKLLRRYLLPGFLGGVVALTVCLVVTSFFSGGRHAMATLAVAFPYAVMLGFGGSLVEKSLLLLQFPAYGLAAGLALADRRFRWPVVALATAHLLAVVWALAVHLQLPEGSETLIDGL